MSWNKLKHRTCTEISCCLCEEVSGKGKVRCRARAGNGKCSLTEKAHVIIGNKEVPLKVTKNYVLGINRFEVSISKKPSKMCRLEVSSNEIQRDRIKTEIVRIGRLIPWKFESGSRVFLSRYTWWSSKMFIFMFISLRCISLGGCNSIVLGFFRKKDWMKNFKCMFLVLVLPSWICRERTLSAD